MFSSNGEIHIRLNTDGIARTRIPQLTKQTEPGPVIVVGGSRKASNRASDTEIAASVSILNRSSQRRWN